MKLRHSILWLAVFSVLTTNILANTELKMVVNGKDVVYEKESIMDCKGYFIGDNIKHYSQLSTGEFSNINCGPTSLKMIGTYFGKDLSVEDMNTLIAPHKEGYTVDNLTDIMDKYGVSYAYGFFASTSDGSVNISNLVDYIDRKYIMLLAINTRSIQTRNKPESNNFKANVGRTYKGDFNHFVLCTGYIKVDGIDYFQILDPLETSYTYVEAKELTKSITDNWRGCLLFSK